MTATNSGANDTSITTSSLTSRSLIPLDSTEGQAITTCADTTAVATSTTMTTQRVRAVFRKQEGRCCCGIASVAIALTALQHQPTNDDDDDVNVNNCVVSEQKVLESEHTRVVAKLDPREVELVGLTLPELARLLEAHLCGDSDTAAAADVTATHAVSREKEEGECIDLFRQAVRRLHTEEGVVVLVNYHIATLGQNDLLGGHISPIGGYFLAGKEGDDKRQEMVLLMDVWPENECVWVPLQALFHAMQGIDRASGLPRGFVTIRSQ